MTAQYYLWYLLLLPIVSINSIAPYKYPAMLPTYICMWAGGQIFWGINADAFENHGAATIPDIQTANYVWFVINMIGMSAVLYYHRVNATKDFFAKVVVDE